MPLWQFCLNILKSDSEEAWVSDGRAVLELMYAAYQSARTGQKVTLPFHPKVRKPIDLWLGEEK